MFDRIARLLAGLIGWAVIAILLFPALKFIGGMIP